MKEADDMTGPTKGKRRRSETDNTNGQQKPWLFQPGQSGNPAGRPKGSRNKLAEDFLSDAYQQWQQHGPKALETMATSEPAKFCQMVANLLPKETLLPDEGRVQISEIKLVIIDTAQQRQERVIEHDDNKPEPVLIENKRKG
jgi:Family of unknown function (DUF5681)